MTWSEFQRACPSAAGAWPSMCRQIAEAGGVPYDTYEPEAWEYDPVRVTARIPGGGPYVVWTYSPVRGWWSSE